MKLVDHSGKKFGKLTAVSYDASARKWLCECDCGCQSMIAAGDLLRGSSKSCGCSKGFHRHGNCQRGKKTSEYSSWYSMISRCRYKTHKAAIHYVNRGIKVCERWHKFENFIADMGPKPSRRHSIERIDNNGNYEPGNCRWATWQEQLNNQRKTAFVEYQGKNMSFSDAWRASQSSVPKDTAYGRIRRGWTLEKAFQCV